MNTIADHWKDYMHQNEWVRELDDREREMVKGVFMAGATACFASLGSITTLMNKRFEELKRYVDQPPTNGS